MQLNYNYSNSAGIAVLWLQQHPCTRARRLHTQDRGWGWGAAGNRGSSEEPAGRARWQKCPVDGWGAGSLGREPLAACACEAAELKALPLPVPTEPKLTGTIFKNKLLGRPTEIY